MDLVTAISVYLTLKHFYLIKLPPLVLTCFYSDNIRDVQQNRILQVTYKIPFLVPQFIIKESFYALRRHLEIGSPEP